MTAGKGVQHSEMFPLLNKDKDNTLEIFQIWLNLPRASKFVDPHFKMLWSNSIPIFRNDENTVEVDVIAGNLGDKKAPDPTPESWASDQGNHVSVLTIKMSANSTWVLPKAVKSLNRMLYFYRGGSLKVEDQLIPLNHSIDLKSEMDAEIHTGDEDCFLLMLQGKPINEPVVQYGPFVMNTDQEIQDAFADYRRNQFGGWPWPEQEQTHPREKSRFALHADGVEETRDL
jgi:quercetin 2,3-dioxygenase